MENFYSCDPDLVNSLGGVDAYALESVALNGNIGKQYEPCSYAFFV